MVLSFLTTSVADNIQPLASVHRMGAIMFSAADIQKIS
jgi:hypothetical protein